MSKDLSVSRPEGENLEIIDVNPACVIDLMLRYTAFGIGFDALMGGNMSDENTHKQPVEVTRDELYRQVWQPPDEPTRIAIRDQRKRPSQDMRASERALSASRILGQERSGKADIFLTIPRV